MLGAALGALVGLFFGPLGLLIGPFLGAAPGSSWSGRTWSKPDARGSGRGSDSCWAPWPGSRWVLLMVLVFVVAWLV